MDTYYNNDLEAKIKILTEREQQYKKDLYAKDNEIMALKRQIAVIEEKIVTSSQNNTAQFLAERYKQMKGGKT